MEAIAKFITGVLIFCWLQFSSVEPNQAEDKLQDKFYENTCPQVEKIIADSVKNAVLLQPRIAAGLIRLHFHDCFVNGCDASILLDKTPSGEPVEKTSRANGFSINVLECIDQVKAEIERECPGVVSCADILAYAAREAVVQDGLPHYPVPGGRRDGMSSSARNVAGNLPSPFQPVKSMEQLFTRKGLSVEDMVVLSGAHSIGHTHCKHIYKRLYNYSATHVQDPGMDLAHSLSLRSSCPMPGTLSKEVKDKLLVPLEPVTPLKLDTLYYTQLLEKKGVLHTDQALTNDTTTKEIVEKLAQNPSEWAAKFTSAMINLGKVDVLPGQEGEIRRNCRAVN